MMSHTDILLELIIQFISVINYISKQISKYLLSFKWEY